MSANEHLEHAHICVPLTGKPMLTVLVGMPDENGRAEVHLHLGEPDAMIGNPVPGWTIEVVDLAIAKLKKVRRKLLTNFAWDVVKVERAKRRAVREAIETARDMGVTGELEVVEESEEDDEPGSGTPPITLH